MLNKKDFYKNVVRNTIRLCNALSDKVAGTVRAAMGLLEELAQFVASIEYTKYGQFHKHSYQKFHMPKPVMINLRIMMKGRRLKA